MKPYDEYGAEYRRAIRRMFDNHPKPTRVNEKQQDMYKRLCWDGWAVILNRRAATITNDGLCAICEELEND